MTPVANRLIAHGAVTCMTGILFSMVATTPVGSLYQTLPPQTVTAGAIIEFVTAVVSVRLAPLGTALIAAGIALRMLNNRLDLAHPTREQAVPAGTQRSLDWINFPAGNVR
ncbi:hypothetical protein [Kocuria sabuli]|uniref:hypothetical protein n=1 Tax=Kocuria sabuli TaxID=3071448 RepID=UPI0034D784DA